MTEARLITALTKKNYFLRNPKSSPPRHDYATESWSAPARAVAAWRPRIHKQIGLVGTVTDNQMLGWAAMVINFHKHQLLLVFAHLTVIGRRAFQSGFPSQPVCCTPSSSAPADGFCATTITEKPFLTCSLHLESLSLLGCFL